jgi:hypothetical protein
MTSEEHEDLEIYNKQGEFLQEFYKLNDFLSNEQTYSILEQDRIDRFEKNLEPKITEKFLETFKHENETLSSMYINNLGAASGEFVAIIFQHLRKDYDLEVFYNNPELAQSLLECEKNENKK